MADGPLLPKSLLAAAEVVLGSVAELNQLDSYAGDGDFGVTMAKAAQLVKEVVGAQDGRQGPELLSSCGAAIARGAPSTSGTLTATALLRAAKALAEGGGGGLPALERCFVAARDAVAARGKASVGDRTVVDGLDAVCTSLGGSVAAGLSLAAGLQAAARAAAQAAEATASMLPRVGRASWAPERALGHPDAGCTLLAKVLEAAAQACAEAD